jgi:D-glycero-alpha-D-manno-heptose 1-phosphate guanylyltransferase
MEAIILCGGLGTRLRPAVADRPKPLAPVAGRPFLHYLIARLQAAGIKRMVLAVSYLHEQITACCGNGAHLGVMLRYAVEPTPLGTAGAVKQAAGLVTGEDFLVLNGDTYLQLEYATLENEHCRSQADLTLTLRSVADAARYGRVELDGAGRILRFGEKSQGPTSVAWVNAGAYVMNRRVLSLIPGERRSSLETELVPRLLQAGRPVFGYPATGYFRDIGVPEDYYRFIQDVAAGVVEKV